MKVTIDTRDNEKQKKCLELWADKTTTDIVYGGSKGSAKSFTGVCCIFGSALLYPGTHWFIARKKLNDLRKHTIPSIYEVFQIWDLSPDLYLKYNGQDSYFTLPNNSRVYLLDAKYLPSDPDYYRFGSMQMTGGWIEEAGEFEEASKNNLAASIGRWKNEEYGITGTLLQTCNPAKNYLYRDYYKPHKAGELPPHKAFIQALPTDNKMLPSGYIDNLNNILTSTQKERLLYGNWEYDDDPAKLMDYDRIVAIWNNNHIPGGKNFITVDVARFGVDKAVIMVWDGLRVIDITTLDKSSIPDQVTLVNTLRERYQVSASHVAIDDDGVGGGVADYIRGCRKFVNNSRPIGKDNYENLKTQCAYKLSELVQQEQIYIAVEQYQDKIIEELEQVKSREMDADNKLKIVKKEQMKEKLGRSPDYFDALNMRMVFELMPMSRL